MMGDAHKGGDAYNNGSGGSGGIITSNAGYDTLPLAGCETKFVVPNCNNGGALIATAFLNPASMRCTRLACYASQPQEVVGAQMAIFNCEKELLAVTDFFAPVSGKNVIDLSASIDLVGGVCYYGAILAKSTMTSTQFFGKDIYVTFGNSANYLAIHADNLGDVMPDSLDGYSESQYRYYVGMLSAVS